MFYFKVFNPVLNGHFANAVTDQPIILPFFAKLHKIEKN